MLKCKNIEVKTKVVKILEKARFLGMSQTKIDEAEAVERVINFHVQVILLITKKISKDY